MGAKLLQFSEEALKAVSKGVRTLSKAVKVTLGPKGRNVVIAKSFGSPVSTKDGVTVAKEVVLKDKFENMGAQLVKEVASKTAEVAGDGTTTAIVLAEAIFTAGLKAVSSGANPMGVKRGLDKACDAVWKELDKLARPVDTHEKIKQIATISANNDIDIGNLIADAMEKVGPDGIVTVSESKTIETYLDFVEGTQFDKGFLSPYFITNAEQMTVEMENARILIVDKKLSTAKEIVPILEKATKQAGQGSAPILLIAEDVEGEALATLVVNRIKGGLQVCAVKAPGFGDNRKALLGDIAAITGASLVTAELGLDLETVGTEVFGRAKRVKVAKELTTIVDGAGTKSLIQERIAQLKAMIAKSTSDYEKGQLESRLGKLCGKVADIKVGAPTKTEVDEKKARVEDAVHATRAAGAEGISAGGGVTLIRCAPALKKLRGQSSDEDTGISVVYSALYAPAIAIADNCGRAGNMVAEKIAEKSGAYGYNGLTDEFCDLIEAGVIDPILVTKYALKNAVSVAGLLLTTACLITDKPTPKAAPAGGMPGGMSGGMGGMGGMGDMM